MLESWAKHEVPEELGGSGSIPSPDAVWAAEFLQHLVFYLRLWRGRFEEHKETKAPSVYFQGNNDGSDNCPVAADAKTL